MRTRTLLVAIVAVALGSTVPLSLSGFVVGAPAPVSRPRPASEPSTLERLLLADESLMFNGRGQMSGAFTTRSELWKRAIRKKAEEMTGPGAGVALPEAALARAEAALRRERMRELDIVLAWLRAGASRKDYEGDRRKVKSILVGRCVRCHRRETSSPLETYDDLKKYLIVEPAR